MKQKQLHRAGIKNVTHPCFEDMKSIKYILITGCSIRVHINKTSYEHPYLKRPCKVAKQANIRGAEHKCNLSNQSYLVRIGAFGGPNTYPPSIWKTTAWDVVANIPLVGSQI